MRNWKAFCGSLKGNFLASGQKNPMLLNQWKSVKDQEGQRDGGSTLCSMNFPTNFLPLSSVCLLWYYSFIIYLGRSQTLLEINSGKKVEQSKGGITSAWLEGVASKLFFLLRFPNSINLTSISKSEATFQTVLPDRKFLKGRELLKNAKIEYFVWFSNNVGIPTSLN